MAPIFSRTKRQVRHGIRTAASVVVGLSAAVGAMRWLSGCVASADFAAVTTGGQKDIASARRLIKDGGIPDPEAITVEGFLSEHAIPITAPA